MNDLVSKCFVIMTLVVSGFFQEGLAEPIQMNFRFPSYPQSDRDVFLVQNFIIYQAFSEVESEKKQTCTFILNPDGELVIEGQEEWIHSFVGALGKALGQEVDKGSLEMQKERYLAFSEDLLEQALIEEIKEEDFLEVKKSLQPLAGMLCAASSAARENLPLTLVLDDPQYHHFYSLPINQSDQNNIHQLIKAMGKSGYWDLLKKKKEMDKLGDKLHHIHPLRFIGYIYSHPHLKGYMVKIMGDIFKRWGFLNGYGKKEGFIQRMTKEMEHNNIMHYLPGFVQSIGINEGEISHFFHHHDWEGLLYYLNKKC